MRRQHRGHRSQYSLDKRLAIHTAWRDRDLSETICRVNTIHFRPGEVLVDSRRQGILQRRR